MFIMKLDAKYMYQKALDMNKYSDIGPSLTNTSDSVFNHKYIFELTTFLLSEFCIQHSLVGALVYFVGKLD